MRHLILTCKQHPELRWSCKSVAYSPGRGYNGARHIFFQGSVKERVPSAPFVRECECSPGDLILAPEDEWSGLTLDEQRKLINED